MPDAPAQPTPPATPPATPAPPAPPAQDPPAETDWKAEARKWETRAKENKAKLDEAAPKLTEYDALVEASKSDLQRANDSVTRWQSEAETWRKAAVGSHIAALAAQDFADASDAVSSLDPAKYLDTGGQINEQAIKADLADLLERKPHWRRSDSAPAPRVPAPNPNQGSGAGRPATDPAAEFGAFLTGQLNRA